MVLLVVKLLIFLIGGSFYSISEKILSLSTFLCRDIASTPPPLPPVAVILPTPPQSLSSSPTGPEFFRSGAGCL